MIINKPYKIGNIEVKNRLIRSATFEAMATDEGYVTPQHLNLYKNLAEGGIGLIITGFAYVHPNGQSAHRQLAIYDDKFIKGIKQIADVVHGVGNGCKVVLQIAHCGRQTGAIEETIAPSAVFETYTEKMPREMTHNEIEEIIEAFALAIRRGKDAGFDGVQIHGAHGWLISSFLSPYTNKRSDEFGGSTENRTRILVDIYNRAVELAGRDFPILLKMNGTDFLPSGLQIEEAKIIAKRLADIGFASFEVSGGMWEIITLPPKDFDWRPTFIPESRLNVGIEHDPAYNLPFAKEISQAVDVPVILIGGINSNLLAEEIINEGSIDFISLCRPLIREPDLPNKWFASEQKIGVRCIYCNECLGTLSEGKGVYCVQDEKV